MGISTFRLAAGPLIKAASPRTRIGAGAYHGTTTQALSDKEAGYFSDFVNNIPKCLPSTVTTGCLDRGDHVDLRMIDTFEYGCAVGGKWPIWW